MSSAEKLSSSQSPYQYSQESPATDVASETPPNVQIRRANISREKAIKAIGVAYVLLSIVCAVMVIVFFKLSSDPEFARELRAPMMAGVLAMIMFGTMFGLAGYGLLKLHSWGKWIAAVAAAFLLTGFPIGTALAIGTFFALFTESGKQIFSKEYRDIIQTTPQVDARLSRIVWIAFGLLAGLLALGTIGILFGP